MKIKTLITDITDVSCIGMFDKGVNRYIEEGWQLVKRMPLSDTRVYAELVKEDDPGEPSEGGLIEAMQAIRCECDKHDSCRDCPLDCECEHRPPDEWDLPVEGEDE